MKSHGCHHHNHHLRDRQPTLLPEGRKLGFLAGIRRKRGRGRRRDPTQEIESPKRVSPDCRCLRINPDQQGAKSFQETINCFAVRRSRCWPSATLMDMPYPAHIPDLPEGRQAHTQRALRQSETSVSRNPHQPHPGTTPTRPRPGGFQVNRSPQGNKGEAHAPMPKHEQRTKESQGSLQPMQKTTQGRQKR